MGKLPKKPIVGMVYTIKSKGKSTSFQCVNPSGFGMWKIVKSKQPYKTLK